MPLIADSGRLTRQLMQGGGRAAGRGQALENPRDQRSDAHVMRGGSGRSCQRHPNPLNLPRACRPIGRSGVASDRQLMLTLQLMQGGRRAAGRGQAVRGARHERSYAPETPPCLAAGPPRVRPPVEISKVGVLSTLGFGPALGISNPMHQRHLRSSLQVRGRARERESVWERVCVCV